MTRHDVRTVAVTLLGIACSAAALWLLTLSVDLAHAAATLTAVNPVPLLSIVAVVTVQLLVRAFRWSLLLPAPGGRRLGVPRLVAPLLVGYLGNAVLPARLGEAMRAMAVARRERVDVVAAIGSVLLERVIDVATLAPVTLAAAVIVDAPEWVVQLAAVATLVGASVLYAITVLPISALARFVTRVRVLRRTRLLSLAERLTGVFPGPSRASRISGAVAASTIAWLLDGASFWLAGQAVGADIGYAGALLVSGVTVLGTAIPSAPGFVGTYELAATTVAAALGVPAAPALAMALVAHVMTLMPMAIAGGVGLVGMGAGVGEMRRSAESPNLA